MATARPLLAVLPDITVPKPWQRFLKRTMDVGLLVCLAPVVTPVMIATAVAVKATSPGPVLFRQDRVGRGGRTFSLLKFRSMAANADDRLRCDAHAYSRYVANGFKLDPDDQRITSVGRFIRRTSIDELPQLFNVLAGQASFVGVRPLLVDDFAHRPRIDCELYKLHRPGLTGLWQVSGRSTVSHDHRMLLDREYLETWGLRADARILASTPAALLRTTQTA